MAGMVAKVHFDGYFVGGRMTGKKFDTSRGKIDDFGKEDFYRFKVGEEHEAVRDGWVIRGFTVCILLSPKLPRSSERLTLPLDRGELRCKLASSARLFATHSGTPPALRSPWRQ